MLVSAASDAGPEVLARVPTTGADALCDSSGMVGLDPEAPKAEAARAANIPDNLDPLPDMMPDTRGRR